MDAEDAIRAASEVTPEIAAGSLALLGTARMASMMMAVSEAIHSECACGTCVSLRAVAEGLP